MRFFCCQKKMIDVKRGVLDGSKQGIRLWFGTEFRRPTVFGGSSDITTERKNPRYQKWGLKFRNKMGFDILEHPLDSL